ncbi:MAG: S41 family peptidase [Hyphomicrobium sp.]
MKFRKLLVAATAALLLAPAVHAAETDEADGETYRLLNLFGDVFERVRSDHVEEASDKQLVEAAISGMLTSLDPHSGYLNAESYREMQVQTRGEFGGLGIEVTMENGLVKVVSPIDETPAAQAGLEPGDLLTHIDGEPVLGLTLPEAVEKMRGRVGSKINLTVRREDREPFDVSIIRDVIRIKSVRSRLEGKVGYVRISSFNEQTQENLEQALDDLNREAGTGLQGIVLDLRNNPGGLLSQAVAVSDAFLDKGEIVSTRSRRSEETQRFNARSGDLANDLPMVVLINGGSASASEIVAGALQDHRRAIILGTKSFGKGSVQTIIPLTGYGAIRLTTARYYTPAGRSIQAKGIEPDIEVTQAKIEEVEQGAGRTEADLRRALENDSDKGSDKGADDVKPDAAEPDAVEPGAGKPGTGEPGAAAPDKEDAEPQDYQLMRAVDLIRGIALYAEKSPVAAAVR